MAQNRQLQKTVNSHAERIRHRRRLLTTDVRFAGRHPGFANFLTREATRANTIGGVVGVTDAEILTGLRGQTDLGGTVPTLTRARHIRQATASGDYTAQGIPIA
jgi:hypothetical protein